MKDLGTKYTDKQIKDLEERIHKIYKEAEKDLDKKIEDFTKKYKAKEDIHQKELEEGKITQQDLDAWKSGQVFQGKQWQSKKDQITKTLYNANQVAVKMTNNDMYGVFAFNSNYQAYQIESSFGINFGFGLYDSATVANLVKNDPQILPKWKIDEEKDYKWNAKKVNNAVVQGIIQGEKLNQIAKRLSTSLCAQNENTMKTFARTGMTQAQNAGRNQRLADAEKLGINMTKEWMATLDSRTRDSHADIDGEKVKISEKFSNGCRYPGDPEGPAREVYNCRCTLVADLVDYPSEYKRYDNIDGKPVENMTYREWEKAKGKEQDKERGRGHVDMTNKDNYTKSKLDWVMIDTGFSEATAKEVLSSIRTFTGNGYDWVIEHPESDQYKNMYEGIEKYINKAPKWNGGNIERGIRMSVADVENIKVGQTISQQNKASSWTTDDKLARTAATNKLKSDEVGVVFHMDLKVGETINGAAVSHLANKPREQEVILSGKSEQVVTSITEEWVTKKKRIFHVHVREK